jgi:nucleoside-diphosphate-sugar epimerase
VSGKLLEVQSLYVNPSDKASLLRIVKENEFKVIYHLSSLLSATSEKDPDLAWDVNLEALKNVLDVARELSE